MPKKRTPPNLTTRSSRSSLKPRREPYWLKLGLGRHLGYRSRTGTNGRRAGTWIARIRKATGERITYPLGLADDLGATSAKRSGKKEILPFSSETPDTRSAMKAAQDWFDSEALKDEDAITESSGPYTVKTAVEDYLDAREGRASHPEIKYSFDAHLFPSDLADIEVSKLTSRKIRRWHKELGASPARLRTRRGAQHQQVRKIAEDDAEGQRKRKVTANRNLASLKAALNFAYRSDETPVNSDTAWRQVELNKNVEMSRPGHLSAAECKRLVNASPPYFKDIVLGAIHTGARYGELCKMNVGDFHASSGSVHIPKSKSGKPRDIMLTPEAAVFFEQQTAGRAKATPIFPKADGSRWRKGHQSNLLKVACKAAKLERSIGFHGLRHSYATLCLMGGISSETLRLNLGHHDTKMIERHYSHLTDEHKRSEFREKGPQYGIAVVSNVTTIDRPKKVRRS